MLLHYRGGPFSALLRREAQEPQESSSSKAANIVLDCSGPTRQEDVPSVATENVRRGEICRREIG